MTYKWQFEKLGDLTINLDAKRKPIKETDRKHGQYPYYGASGIVDFVEDYLFEGEHLLIGEDGENLRTRQTPIAFLATGKFWVNNHAHIVIGNHRASTRFLEYAILGTDISPYLTGAVMPKLTQSNLNRIKVPCPPIAIQNSIVNILGKLDDRIIVLKETNLTIESITQALFKYWFIDFGPVHAKRKGIQPEGMDEATAALFSNSFEQSELGEIPRSWRAGTLGDLASFQNGYAFKGKDWAKSGHPVIKIGNVKPGLISFKGCSFVGQQSVNGLDRFKLHRGDLLVGMTGYVGETGLVPEVSPAAYLNQRVGRLSSDNGVQDIGFIYCLTRNEKFRIFAETQAHGSAQANVSGTDLLKLPSVIPDSKVLASFNAIVHPLIESIISNYETQRTLAKLRDTLLPRLISGQLSFSEGKKEVVT
jgi:type I restriction enzyme S subunit